MLVREEVVHVAGPVQPLQFLVAGQSRHDANLELVEVHVAQLRPFVRGDDRPVALWHVLETGAP